MPAAQGLYDPADEKDACGLAMVATLRGTAGHDIITAALDALRHLEHRGAVGSDAGTGDGAGIVTQVPDAFLREVAEFALPPPARYAVGNAFLPVDPTARSGVKQRLQRIAASEGLECSAGARCPCGPTSSAPSPARRCRSCSSSSCRARQRPRPASWSRASRSTGSTFRLRKRAERELDLYFASLSCRTVVYKGMVTTLAARAVLPRPLRRALRLEARARALALLDEHVPVVAARAAVPHDRAQRRDQHHPGQPQLDARAPVAARVRAPRRPRPDPAHRDPRRERLRLVRRGRGAAHARRPQPPARRHDDGARGVGEPDRDRPRRGAPSTSTTRCSWSRGTARRRSCSPTARSSARPSTATACVPVATS